MARRADFRLIMKKMETQTPYFSALFKKICLPAEVYASTTERHSIFPFFLMHYMHYMQQNIFSVKGGGFENVLFKKGNFHGSVSVRNGCNVKDNLLLARGQSGDLKALYIDKTSDCMLEDSEVRTLTAELLGLNCFVLKDARVKTFDPHFGKLLGWAKTNRPKVASHKPLMLIDVELQDKEKKKGKGRGTPTHKGGDDGTPDTQTSQEDDSTVTPSAAGQAGLGVALKEIDDKMREMKEAISASGGMKDHSAFVKLFTDNYCALETTFEKLKVQFTSNGPISKTSDLGAELNDTVQKTLDFGAASPVSKETIVEALDEVANETDGKVRI